MFALGETDLCAASEYKVEKGIVCKKLIRRGFRFTLHGVENANKKSRPRRVRMTRVGAAHQNRIQHKSSCAMRQRNMRNRQKNGVEFAKEAVEKGQDTVTAALTAAHLRFRPIVMTSLAFILGLLPLVFASGPGSASRQGIGTGVFFGMLVAITVGIVFVPFFFVWIYRIKAKLKR